MQKMASFLMVSLDGYHEGPNPWSLEWHNVDDEFNDFAQQQLDASEYLVFGRATYQGMAQYWPSPEGPKENPVAVVDRMNNASKIVISRTLIKPEPEWKNTRLIKDNIAEEVTRLKLQARRDLLVLGSSALTASLMDIGLLDELRIIVNPVVLGSGHSVLAAAKKTQLKLLSNRTFKSGNVLLTYEPLARRA